MHLTMLTGNARLSAVSLQRCHPELREGSTEWVLLECVILNGTRREGSKECPHESVILKGASREGSRECGANY